MNTPGHFDLSAQWRNGSTDIAEISLRVGDMVISRVADTHKHTVRDFFRASATALSFWLAENWWRLRWETIGDLRFPSVDWRLRHELNSANGGALWPPVTIFSVGDRIAFSPSVGRRYIDGPQTYFDFKIALVSAKDYERGLDDFFQAVLAKCARTADGEALGALLAQIATERDDPELAAWRRLEACLGFDPDAAPDEVIHALIDLEAIVGAQGVEEAAHAQPGEASVPSLGLALEATRESKIEVDLSLADRLERDWNLPSYASPWQMAEAAALEVRSVLGVTKGLLDHSAFSDMLKARWTDLKSATATARELPYGARIAQEGKFRVALQTKQPYDRRFELTRQFADAVWQKGLSFGIVSRSKNDRQKFQRAFANNLLCPFEYLQYAIDVNEPTADAIAKAARAFGVNPSVVRNQLIYKGYLPFENSSEEAETA